MVSAFPYIGLWLAWIIGNGKSMRISLDPWASARVNYKLSENLRSFLAKKCIYTIADTAVAVPQTLGSIRWRSANILEMPHPIVYEWNSFISLLVSNFIHLNMDIDDKMVWSKNVKNGIYTTKLGYKAMMEEMHPSEPLFWTKSLWKSPGPKKAKLVLWLSLQNRLLTWDNIQKRGWIGPGRYSLCRNEAESVLHILFSCTYAKMVWNRSSISLNPLDQSTIDSF